MTSSPLPWTMKVATLGREEQPIATLYDAFGKPIGFLNDARDADIILGLQQQVLELEEENETLKAKLYKLDNMFDLDDAV